MVFWFSWVLSKLICNGKSFLWISLLFNTLLLVIPEAENFKFIFFIPKHLIPMFYGLSTISCGYCFLNKNLINTFWSIPTSSHSFTFHWKLLGFKVTRVQNFIFFTYNFLSCTLRHPIPLVLLIVPSVLLSLCFSNEATQIQTVSSQSPGSGALILL